ncbi:hypothetical protein [Prosthecodimorpha staleyi]|uniref:Uncharacterized protein n=1 Tax=Prosthecodimorpha staleyi TaxID=2840188 RepID=A0A947D0J9_9HYPH|nr:hypothetical protein [Prosthecodimorpha staleyi]MBT9288361.1 hypothetical protein [Prosthecodimorpha staleyi]
MSLQKMIATIAAAAGLTGSILFGAAHAERIETAGKADRIAIAATNARIAAAFDLISACTGAGHEAAPDCASDADNGILPVRTITIEKRDEAARTSVLVRMPAPEASR